MHLIARDFLFIALLSHTVNVLLNINAAQKMAISPYSLYIDVCSVTVYGSNPILKTKVVRFLDWGFCLEEGKISCK